MKVCKVCNIKKPLNKFPKQSRNKELRRNICYSCKYKKELAVMTYEQKQRKKEKIREWGRRNKYHARYKSIKYFDKNKFGCKTIDRKTYKEMIKQPCFYCERKESGGIDRLNNSKGHVKNNVVPCCEKCNFILGDIPFKAKLLLKDGLKNCHERRVLNRWKIPTKRK